jgi:hypothetical protein
VKQGRILVGRAPLRQSGEDSLGYTPVGTDREVDSVATGPEVGDGIHVQGKVVPI